MVKVMSFGALSFFYTDLGSDRICYALLMLRHSFAFGVLLFGLESSHLGGQAKSHPIVEEQLSGVLTFENGRSPCDVIQPAC
jgi:hypothetical protein